MYLINLNSQDYFCGLLVLKSWPFYNENKIYLYKIPFFLQILFFQINSGSEMLIAFHSSPYSAPLQTGIPNRGFELDVDILFADSDSYDFVQATKCEFHINASNPGKL